MELYLFRPEEHQRLYGCSNITVEDVPLEKRQHVVEGVIIIALTVIYYILYIPCIPSLYRHMKNPCYKLLFFISIVDCTILWVVGFMHGYFAITGVVYCSHPKLIYFLGCYIMCVWACETSGQVTLVINRCVAMLSSELENTMFGGRRIYLWFSASIVWGIFWLFYVIPVLFTGIYFSWFFNPYVGYRDDVHSDYFTNIHTAYDGSFSVGIPTLYIIFTILFFAKSHRMKGSKTVSKKQKMMLLQVFIISMLNFAAVSIYVYMMYFVPNMFLMHFAQFCWFHIHGFPPVIYLTFNASIRGDAINMFKNIGRKFKGQETKELATTLTKIEPSNTDSML